jgi:hypothetical protein
MTIDNAAGLFWMCVILLGFIVPLIAGAIWIEVLAPRSRSWLRRLHKLSEGRLAQHSSHEARGK